MMRSKRRSFLKKAGAAFALITGLGGKAIAGKEPADEKEDTVKMLTPDGKLVEVPKSIFSSSSKKSVNNKDILNWRKTQGE